MKRSLGLLSFFIVVGLCMQAGCSLAATSGEWRYKTTVVVETPEGIKSGYAVRQVTGTYYGKGLQSNVMSMGVVDGEAVVVDLGERGKLFASMRGVGLSDYHATVVKSAFPYSGMLSADMIKYYETLKNAKAVLTLKQYPLLVYFKDVTNPTSVESVYEIKNIGEKIGPKSDFRLINDRFEEVFGKGVHLKEITIEMTDEAVTHTGITEILPWLNNMRGYLSGKFSSNTNELPDVLDTGDFYRIKK